MSGRRRSRSREHRKRFDSQEKRRKHRLKDDDVFDFSESSKSEESDRYVYKEKQTKKQEKIKEEKV